MISTVSLKYYSNNTWFDLSINGNVCEHPLYAHESCKIRVSPNGTPANCRRSARWDFGDGTIVEGQYATHYYRKPGKYTIRVTYFKSDFTPAADKPYVTVVVKEVVPTVLSVNREYNLNPKLCRSSKLFELVASLSNTVISEPRISARRTFPQKTQIEKSYFEIKDTYQYHLKPYYAFLKETTEYDFDNDKQWNKILKPTEEYEPEYHTIYGEFGGAENYENCEWKFYCLRNDNLNVSLIKIFAPSSIVTSDYRGKDNDLFYQTVKIEFKNNISEIPKTATPCGKIASFNVWYKTDIDLTEPNDLYFFFNQDDLKFTDDLLSDTNYINIPPLGITIYPSIPDEGDLIPILSLNGFANNVNENVNPNIETYLQQSLYKNYQLPAIFGYFIKNENISDISALEGDLFNLYKNPDNIGSLHITVNGEQLPAVSEESTDYYKSYDIIPKLKNGQFIINHIDNDGSLLSNIYSTDNIIDLDEIILPTEKLFEGDTKKLIDCYTPHPLFADADKFKQLLNTVLSNGNMLNYIISKGLNFIDDNINYKTCYIDRLLDILDSVGESVTMYDSSLFKNINELRDITRILSMGYSTLFGNTYNDIYDFHFTSTTKGKNVGDQILPNDVFYLNDKAEIIAIKRNGVISKLTKAVKNFIILEDYSGIIKTGSFETIKCHLYLDYSDQTAEWHQRKDNKKLMEEITGAFSLAEYEESWLWNLLLPPEFINYNNKESLIYRYYSFYLFNDNAEYERKFNFIAENTIPLKDGKQISYEEWNDINGFTYHCLIKVLFDKLQLK